MYSPFSVDVTLSSVNSLWKMKTPFLLSSVIYNSNTHAHDAVSLSCSISVQLNQQIQNHHLHFICTYWHTIFIHILQYIVLFIYKYFSYLQHTHTHTYFRKVSTYTQHISVQLRTYNFINILYFNMHFKLLLKTWSFIFVYEIVWCSV